MLRSEIELENLWDRGWGELESKGQVRFVALDDLTGLRFDRRIFDS